MQYIKDQENLNEKRILLRLDLNVPLKNGEITETNLLEQKNINQSKKVKEKYHLKLKPFEIKTFKVKV